MQKTKEGNKSLPKIQLQTDIIQLSEIERTAISKKWFLILTRMQILSSELLYLLPFDC